MIDLIATLLTLTAVLAYLNHRLLGLPSIIGVMAIALAFSLAALGAEALGWSAPKSVLGDFVAAIDFNTVLMQGMLSVLLFAGALHVDFSELRAVRLPIAVLSIAGTTLSTLLVASLLRVVLPWVGINLDFEWCLLFGALISPTDPIAVMGILKIAGAPPRLATTIAGESLFNDGVGVVLFGLTLTLIARPDASGSDASMLPFVREALGGLSYGAVLGYVTYRLLKSIDSYQEEVLLTLAAVLGGYALAHRLQVSGPLAMVVAGLYVGHHGRKSAMSDLTRQYVDQFWELADAILNWLLFVLLGLEALRLSFKPSVLAGGLLAVLVVMTARLLSVMLPLGLMTRWLDLPRGSVPVLVWGGLRGGISVALAFSLPPGPERELLLGLTYVVVCFSILVQGLSIGWAVRSWVRGDLP
jgi:CPA1 family monovalent cation:H+ antiporter